MFLFSFRFFKVSLLTWKTSENSFEYAHPQKVIDQCIFKVLNGIFALMEYKAKVTTVIVLPYLGNMSNNTKTN